MREGAAPIVVAMVPTYNGAAFVAETLASLAAQDYPALRVIVSDDASTDGTWAICEAFAARDPRFEVVRQPSRLGWIGNANAALARADGDYAFFAPHDDLFAPSYVTRAVAALAARPDAVLAFSDTVGFGELGPPAKWTAERTVRSGGRVRRGLRYVLGGDRDRWAPYRGLVRAGVLRRVGGLRPSGAGEIGADGRWLFRLHLVGSFARVPEVLCRKRFHAGSAQLAWPRRRMLVLFLRAAYARDVLDADLRPHERAVLLAAVVVSVVLVLFPLRLQRAVHRLFAAI